MSAHQVRDAYGSLTLYGRCAIIMIVYFRGSEGSSRFSFMVDVDHLEQECITAIHVRGV